MCINKLRDKDNYKEPGMYDELVKKYMEPNNIIDFISKYIQELNRKKIRYQSYKISK